MNVRICHLITTFYSRAGSSRRTLEIMCGLKKKGYDFDLVVGKDSSESLIEAVKQEGIKVKRIPWLQKYVAPVSDLRAIWALKKHFSRERYDLVHTHLAKAGILGRFAAKWAKVPVTLHTVHGPSFPESKSWWQRSLYRQLERLAERHTQAMVFVGKELQTQYLAAGIGTQENSYLIYTGRDFTPFLRAASQDVASKRLLRSKLGLKEDDLVVGYVARVVPSKRHILAIQAGEKLLQKFSRLCFLFVGQANLPSEEHYKKVLMAEVARRGIQDRVVFLDYQPDIENYYAIFDVFILPSLYEGLPNVILEAKIMNLPIVAFDCGGVREILGEQGNVVSKGDAEGFHRRLEQILEDLSRGLQGANSSEMMENLINRWSISSMLQNKDELYRKLLRGIGHV
jgi:glycosyltransferase involved in cell wall biosynthesis